MTDEDREAIRGIVREGLQAHAKREAAEAAVDEAAVVQVIQKFHARAQDAVIEQIRRGDPWR